MHALVIVVTAIACVHIGVSVSLCTNSFGDHFEGGECFATNLNSLSNSIAKNESILKIQKLKNGTFMFIGFKIIEIKRKRL